MAQILSSHLVHPLNQNNEGSPENCYIPWDHIPSRSYPLFKARAILEGILSTHGYQAKRT